MCCNILCILTAIHTVPKNLRRKTDHVGADAAVYVWFLCQIQVHMQYVHLCTVQKNQTYTVASAPAVTGYKVFMRRLNMFLGERSARMLLNNNITVYNITFVKPNINIIALPSFNILYDKYVEFMILLRIINIVINVISFIIFFKNNVGFSCGFSHTVTYRCNYLQ